jgi:hypothetical protein
MSNQHGSSTGEKPETHERSEVMTEKSKGLDRRNFMKITALAVGSAAFAGRISFVGTQQPAEKPEGVQAYLAEQID